MTTDNHSSIYPEEIPESQHMDVTLQRAVRLKCYECSGENWNEVKYCMITDCYLHKFRQGFNPDRVGKGAKMTEEHKAKLQAGREKTYIKDTGDSQG